MIFSRSLAESQIQHHDAHSNSDKGIKHQGFKIDLWLSSTAQSFPIFTKPIAKFKF